MADQAQGQARAVRITRIATGFLPVSWDADTDVSRALGRPLGVLETPVRRRPPVPPHLPTDRLPRVAPVPVSCACVQSLLQEDIYRIVLRS